MLGFVVGPALQAAAAPLGPGQPYPSPGDYAHPLRLDMYTAAGWINAVLGLINFVLFLPFCFKERKIAAREAMLAHGKGTGTYYVTFISTYMILRISAILIRYNRSWLYNTKS